ncbi:GTP 3',8-cyclase MoaA [Candidatus Bathyarchaeota archaeon]|nr:GTP 3',8-cyclase MoaA [Candidatus Bathyarchaeota archaeon]
MIKDPCGRPLDNLRLSVTQRCNLSCFFCHREGESSPTTNEMTPREIECIGRIAVSQGIKKIKITGGEPLLRGDILDIIRRLSDIPHLHEVAMTTNGILLHDLAQPLKTAGLARVNVSLSTLKPSCYTKITGVNAIRQVLIGIKEAARVGLSPIKVNMVLLKGLNDDHVQSMVNFTQENGLILQLIEFESPLPETAIYKKYHFELDDIEKKLREKAVRSVTRRMQKRRKYFLEGGGEVEIVRPMHNTTFCKSCSRLRVTSDGKFKPCLFRNDNLVDFLTPMQNGASVEEVTLLLLEAVKRRKPYFV